MNIAAGLRNLRRAREIASVLIFDYGFGYLLDQLDLTGVLPVGRRREMAAAHVGLSGPARLRLALAQLGPSFIKLGQVLSARADLLPPAYVAELRRLQDRAPPVPFDEIRGVVETELGRPIEQVFAEFDPSPLSAASLGQVYGAVLRDGREVTVKVLRPGVERVIEADLQILADAANLLPRQVPALRRYDLPAFVRRFAGQLEDELVYTLEARNTDRIRDNLVSMGSRVRVPGVIWEATRRRVLTAERLYGRRVDELSGQSVSFDRSAAARELGRAVLLQIFVDGFFHGDPHQGNILLAEDGTVIMLDLGIVGHLDLRARQLLAGIVHHAYREDIDGVVDDLFELGALGPDTDLVTARAELSRIVGRFLGLSRKELAIGELLSRTLRTLWVHEIRVPLEMSLAAKALLMTEAVCSELDAECDFRELARPVVEEAMARLLRPSAVSDRLWRAAEGAARRVARIPGRLDHVLSLLESGGLRVRVDDSGADSRIAGLGRSINRLALSIISAALLVSGALYVAAAKHAVHLGLGIAALTGGVLLGLVVALAVLRPGRV